MKENLIFKSHLSSRRGFTLIELLIVIAIIGVLSTLLMVNFVGIRQRARDAQRKSDLRQIQSALEMYRSDVGSYPVVDPASKLNSTNCPTSSSFVYVSTIYMQKVPCDPLTSDYYNSGNYSYYSSDGRTYALCACLENTSETTGSPLSCINNGCSSNIYYVLNNP